MKKKIAGLVIIFLTAGCIGAADFLQERNRKTESATEEKSVVDSYIGNKIEEYKGKIVYSKTEKEDTENLGEQSQETVADMVKIDEYEENHRTILWENRTYYVDKKVEEEVISDYAGIIVSEESDQENVTVYTLENISQNLAVVIQNQKGEYYIYINSEYCADTLGQFLNDIGAEQELEFSNHKRGQICLNDRDGKYYYMKVGNKNLLWETIFSQQNEDAENAPDMPLLVSEISLNLYIRSADWELEVNFTDDGIIIINIDGTSIRHYFKGQEKYIYDFIDRAFEQAEEIEMEG